MIRIETPLSPVRALFAGKGNCKNLRHKSAEDMFDWWIKGRERRSIAEDCNSIPLFSEDDGWVL